MSNLKLNDTATVIVTKAYLNANIVPSQEKCGISSSRSYAAAIRSFIKNEWVRTTGGLKGMAQDGDYANAEGQRLFFTQAFLDAFYGTEDSIAAIVPNDETTAIVDVVEMLEDTDEDEDTRERSAVASAYKKAYAELKAAGGSGQGCNDQIDKWMRATFNRTVKVGNRNVVRLDREALIAFANENNIFAPKYLTLNNGMLRMDVANHVRRLIKKGTVIKHNGKTVLRTTPAKKAA